MKSSSMRKSCFRAYSKMARRWLRTSCCAVEIGRLGDGLHGLSMEFVFGCFIGQVRNTERVMFPAAELFGQNGRLFLTEPCRSPTPTSLDPSDSRCQLPLRSTGARSPGGGAATTYTSAASWRRWCVSTRRSPRPTRGRICVVLQQTPAAAGLSGRRHYILDASAAQHVHERVVSFVARVLEEGARSHPGVTPRPDWSVDSAKRMVHGWAKRTGSVIVAS